MILDNKKLHLDILKRLNAIKKPQRYLQSTKIGISRATLHRLSKNKPITFQTFLKLLNWLNLGNEKINANRYIYKKQRKYNYKK